MHSLSILISLFLCVCNPLGFNRVPCMSSVENSLFKHLHITRDFVTEENNSLIVTTDCQ